MGGLEEEDEKRTFDHVLDFGGRQLADRVGDGDVGAAAGCLFGGGDLEDTVDVDLEHDFEDSVAGLHGRNGRKSEFTQRSIVFTVHTLTLEDGELDGLPVDGQSNSGLGKRSTNWLSATVVKVRFLTKGGNKVSNMFRDGE